MSIRLPTRLDCRYQYCNNPCCECNINYAMSYLFFISSSCFICYVIYENPIKIHWGEYGNTSKCAVSLTWILVTSLLARCMCVTERYEPEVSSGFNINNNYLYYDSSDSEIHESENKNDNESEESF